MLKENKQAFTGLTPVSFRLRRDSGSSAQSIHTPRFADERLNNITLEENGKRLVNEPRIHNTNTSWLVNPKKINDVRTKNSSGTRDEKPATKPAHHNTNTSWLVKPRPIEEPGSGLKPF